MIILPFVIILIPYTTECTPESTDLRQQLAAFYGDDINLTRAEAIIREEAATLGLTITFFDACSETVKSLLPSDNEIAELNEEVDGLEFHHTRINAKDEILPLIESRAPKMFEAIASRLAIIELHMVQLHPSAQSFTRNVGETFLDGILSYMNTRNTLVSFADMSLTMKKISEMYQLLPLDAKKDIERAFCFNTSNRILTEENKIQRFLAELALP